jgi:hydroxyethylthiazole kinase-like uncharacterized protein yjeF
VSGRPAIQTVRKALRRHPLPQPDGDADKEERGRAVIVAGSRAVPGAALLCGVAALRAGAGKLQLALPASLAIPSGIAMPEAGILALPETDGGDIASGAAGQLRDPIAHADAVLIGPGMTDETSCAALTRAVLQSELSSFVLDAGALAGLMAQPDAVRRHNGRVVLTPHAGEMAALLELDKRQIEAQPQFYASQVAQQLGCVVALKGSVTHIADAQGAIWRNRCDAVGLGTAGSGDVLAGILVGLLARGATPLGAALWAVHVHGRIGERLARDIGRLGYLARELLDEIPSMLGAVQREAGKAGRR